MGVLPILPCMAEWTDEPGVLVPRVPAWWCFSPSCNDIHCWYIASGVLLLDARLGFCRKRALTVKQSRGHKPVCGLIARYDEPLGVFEDPPCMSRPCCPTVRPFPEAELMLSAVATYPSHSAPCENSALGAGLVVSANPPDVA